MKDNKLYSNAKIMQQSSTEQRVVYELRPENEWTLLTMFESLRQKPDKKKDINVPSVQGTSKTDYISTCFVYFYDLRRCNVSTREFNLTRIQHLVLSSPMFQHLNLRVVSNSNSKVYSHELANNQFTLEDIQQIL